MEFIKQEINLETYLKMGGKIEKLDYKSIYIDFGGKDDRKEIIKIENKGLNLNRTSTLFNIYFKGESKPKIYSDYWIKIKVKLELSIIYK